MANVRTLTIGGVTYDLQDNISGYITGITSSDVTTALGFTPYNATNPNGYTNNTGTITSIKTTAGAHTTINVSSGAANFNVPTKTSHLTNDSGFITSAPVTSVNGSTGDVTVTVPTKTSDLTNDSGFITSAPVTSVNGQTGAVTVSVPTQTSDLSNDGDGASPFVTYISMMAEGFITADNLAEPAFRAADATSKAVLQQAFGVLADIVVPSSYTQQAQLLYDLAPRTWFCWMNGTEMEFARLSVSVNTSNSAITMYLRGRTSIATGIMGVDSSWTVTPLASDAEGVAY